MKYNFVLSKQNFSRFDSCLSSAVFRTLLSKKRIVTYHYAFLNTDYSNFLYNACKSHDVVFYSPSSISFEGMKILVNYVERRVAKYYRNVFIGYETVPTTVGSIARNILRALMKRVNVDCVVNRTGLLPENLPFFRAPLYSEPSNIDCWIDLSRAHYNIYKHFCLDDKVIFTKSNAVVGVERGKVKLSQINGDKLSKQVLRAIYGVMENKTFQFIYKGERFEIGLSENYCPPFHAPHLLYMLFSCLHYIASEAIRNGCKYINTDCYAFERGKELKFLEFLKFYNIPYKIYYGNGLIKGVNSYSFESENLKRETFLFRKSIRVSRFSNIISNSTNFFDYAKEN